MVQLKLLLDRTPVRPESRNEVHVVAEVFVPLVQGEARVRPPLSVVFVLDASASMKGPPIEQVGFAAERLALRLQPEDRVAVVAFSDSATTVVPLVAADRAGAQTVAARARRLQAQGHSNIEAGLRAAAALLPPRAAHERQVILLCSDGVPTVGASGAPELAAIARSLRPDVSTSVLGFGQTHQEDTLAAVAEGGGGNFHFIADARVAEVELARALGAQGEVAAEAVELSLAPGSGVELLRVLNGPPLRYGADGVVVPLPDLRSGMKHVTVAHLEVNTGRETGPLDAVRATLRYRGAGERHAASLTAVGVMGIAPKDPELHAYANEQVLLARCEEARSESRALADREQFDGAAAVLRGVMQRLEQTAGFVQGSATPLAEAYEQLLDEASVLERRPKAEEYRMVRKAQVQAHLQAEPETDPMPMMQVAVAGELPNAYLEVLDGPSVGKTFPLGKTALVGRTRAADVQLPSERVSRQHTRIVGQRGAYYVVDLGSSNGTYVNNERVDAGSRKLEPGDELKVGDVGMRYVEKPKQ
jgi:Ca-activated chloride channel family protein